MYLIECHTFTDPLFTHIHTTYVLTLACQPDRKAAMLERLRKTPLTSVVKFVINPGAEAKGMDMNVADDLLHVSKFACHMALADDRPAVFLEDDCEFTSSMTAAWAKVAEKRILTIDAITFGAFMKLSVPVTRDWIRVIIGSNTHGMLLSPGGMAILLDLPFTGRPHDVQFYKNARPDAPHWPVAVQRHYRTKNSGVYDPSGILTFVRMKLLNQHLDPLPAYMCAHFIGSIGGLYTIIGLMVLAGYAISATTQRD